MLFHYTLQGYAKSIAEQEALYHYAQLQQSGNKQTVE